MLRRWTMWMALLAMVSACGGDGGDGSGAGGAGGGGGGGKKSFDFDVCTVFTHGELEELVGNQLKEFKVLAPNNCDWEPGEPGEISLSVTLYPRYDHEMYLRSKGQLDDWDQQKDLAGMGDEAFFGFRDSLSIDQGAILARKNDVGVFALVTGESIDEAKAEQILRKFTNRYLTKL